MTFLLLRIIATCGEVYVVQGFLVFIFCVEVSVPVSYTHLDVYKRQGEKNVKDVEEDSIK